jgi:hypothetical protein
MLIVLTGTFVLYSRLTLLKTNVIRHCVEAVFEKILWLDTTNFVRDCWHSKHNCVVAKAHLLRKGEAELANLPSACQPWEDVPT